MYRVRPGGARRGGYRGYEPPRNQPSPARERHAHPVGPVVGASGDFVHVHCKQVGTHQPIWNAAIGFERRQDRLTQIIEGCFPGPALTIGANVWAKLRVGAPPTVLVLLD